MEKPSDLRSQVRDIFNKDHKTLAATGILSSQLFLDSESSQPIDTAKNRDQVRLALHKKTCPLKPLGQNLSAKDNHPIPLTDSYFGSKHGISIQH